ncbi:UvrD-helicase domain-containing protein [Bacteroidales bacterium OttesenSCG-928-M11]|nr:UvrD-helicase domain-containing protein [Bacteroidales bacterium OttesenSCG-928-M11]
MSSSKLKIYKASAGSGKTYTLAAEYIKELLIKNSLDNHRYILAVTFTKDATGEIKNRILAELYGLAFNTADSKVFLSSVQQLLKENGKPMKEEDIRKKSRLLLEHILRDYSRLNITTIDSFFQRVLRNLARELGTGSRFNLEMNTEKVLNEAVKAVIEKANHNKQILDWLTTYVENKLDEGKNWNVEEEILKFSKCIYNEFFQENEKDLQQQLKDNPEIFRELAKHITNESNKCVDLFKSNAQEISTILDRYQLELSDFGNSKHGINYINKLSKGDYKAEVGSYVRKCLDDPSFWGAAKSKRKAEIEQLAVNHFIPLLKQSVDKFLFFRTIRMIKQNLHQLGLIWDITAEISRLNKENNRFMLSDTSLFLNQMIDDSDAPFIYEKIGAEINHVMIDEFQDTSRLQWKNFKALLSDILSNNEFSLIVGDVKQSIYRWRNGDWRILDEIDTELRTNVFDLATNYRSEEVVIDFNNCFFTSSGKIINSLYKEKIDDQTSPFERIYAKEKVSQISNKKTRKGYVSIDFLANENEVGDDYDTIMKQAVLQKLLFLQAEGVPAKDICILTRKNSHIVELGDYLSSMQNEYPQLNSEHYLNVISDEAFQLNSSLAIRIIIEALRSINEPDNTVSQTQLDFYLSMIGVERMEVSREQLVRMPVFELISYIYRTYKLENIEGQSPYMFTFLDALTNCLSDGSTDITSFLNHWNEDLHKKTVSTGEGMEGIRAMSIHKSKGLQFDTVIVPYCDWKLSPAVAPTVWCGPKEGFYNLRLMPLTYSKLMNETEIFSEEYKSETVQSWMDNLNVLYVAFTRAEKNLIILAKDNPSMKEVSLVSDLLLVSVDQLNGDWDSEKRSFFAGNIQANGEIVKNNEDNLLKKQPDALSVSFVSNEFQKGETVFRQSNQSFEFLHPNLPSKEQYVSHGNIMHKLFEQINTSADIERAIDNQIYEGIILPKEKNNYRSRIEKALQQPEAKDWFSGEYINYTERTILWQENGEVKEKRPDRVLLAPDTTKVIDFKFGKSHASHKEQVKQYVDLLKSMDYPDVKGYVWYVEEHEIVQV